MKRCYGFLILSLFVFSANAQEFLRIGSGLAGSYPVFGAKVAELFNKNIDGVKASTFVCNNHITISGWCNGTTGSNWPYGFAG